MVLFQFPMNNEFNTQPKHTTLNQFSEYNADQQQQDNVKTATKNPTTPMDQQNNPMTGNSNNGDCAADVYGW